VRTGCTCSCCPRAGLARCILHEGPYSSLAAELPLHFPATDANLFHGPLHVLAGFAGFVCLVPHLVILFPATRARSWLRSRGGLLRHFTAPSQRSEVTASMPCRGNPTPERNKTRRPAAPAVCEYHPGGMDPATRTLPDRNVARWMPTFGTNAGGTRCHGHSDGQGLGREDRHQAGVTRQVRSSPSELAENKKGCRSRQPFHCQTAVREAGPPMPRIRRGPRQRRGSRFEPATGP